MSDATDQPRSRNDVRKKGGGGKRRNYGRMTKVEMQVARNVPSHVIAKQVAKEYGVDPRTVYADLAKVWTQLAETAAQERPYRKMQMRITMQRLYSRAEQAGNFDAAIRILDRLCRLDGLYEMEEAVVGPKDAPMTTAQQRTRIEQLLRNAIALSGKVPTTGAPSGDGEGSN